MKNGLIHFNDPNPFLGLTSQHWCIKKLRFSHRRVRGQAQALSDPLCLGFYLTWLLIRLISVFHLGQGMNHPLEGHDRILHFWRFLLTSHLVFSWLLPRKMSWGTPYSCIHWPLFWLFLKSWVRWRLLYNKSYQPADIMESWRHHSDKFPVSQLYKIIHQNTDSDRYVNIFVCVYFPFLKLHRDRTMKCVSC